MVMGVRVPGVWDSHFFGFGVCFWEGDWEEREREREDSMLAITPERIAIPIVPHP